MTRKYLLLIASIVVALLVLGTMFSDDGHAQTQSGGNTELEVRALISILNEAKGERVMLAVEGKDCMGRCEGIVQGCLVKVIHGSGESQGTSYVPVSRIASVRLVPMPAK